MVDTSNEKIHPLFHSQTDSYRIYRIGSLSRTIKRYDGVATQGSSILIGYCLYSISYRLTSTSVFITELVPTPYWSIQLAGSRPRMSTPICVDVVFFSNLLYTVAKPKHNQNTTTPKAQRTNISYFVILREYCVNSWPICQSKSFKSVNFA